MLVVGGINNEIVRLLILVVISKLFDYNLIFGDVFYFKV